MKKEKILRQIKNLLDLADDQNSLAEAETAAKKAQYLIMKYNVEEAEIAGGQQASVEESTYPLWKIEKAQEAKWIPNLFHSIAKFNFCTVLTGKKWVEGKRRKVLYILGESHNVEMVRYLGEQLVHRIRSIRKKSWESYQGDEGYHMYLRGFMKGAAYGIHEQLKSNQEEFATDESTAIIISKKNQIIEDYLAEHYPNLKSGRSSGTRSNSGFRDGVKTGKNLNINGGLTGKNGSRLLN